ncbi:MAG: dihydroorotase [Cyclobacteriaceae bacterium]|nr:dihydroorotase [Cyclobacteriaceae bacterium]
MKTILIRNANIVNEGQLTNADIFIKDRRIEKIAPVISNIDADIEIEAENKYILPGVIDDQVHFREPGLTHKADIASEARAAVAGGTTSFMEMPNTVPQTTSHSLLEEKFSIAAEKSLANFSFYMGATNDNIDEIVKINPKKICGVKIFMGSSTGNMLVDDTRALEKIFSESPVLIATHCEDEKTIQKNLAIFKKEFGDNIPVEYHPVIRSAEACYLSSSLAVELAKKHQARLHVLHISTEKELELFEQKPLKEKKITAEACIHHLWFDKSYYASKGSFIKWNPAVKDEKDRTAILQALIDGRIDVVATDHAPHTLEEKELSYLKCPSGGPMVQHSLVAMLELYHKQRIDLPLIAEKMAHNVADIYNIKDRGYIREGYYADLAIVDLNFPWTVDKASLLYKCQWSPFLNHLFHSKVTHTIVSGHLAFAEEEFFFNQKGIPLEFDR